MLRILNAFYAALFLVMALVCVAFLSAARDGFGNGGVYSSAAWAALFALFALLAFLNMRRAGDDVPGDAAIALNLAAALPMLVGLAGLDPAGRFLCGASAVPFAVTAASWLARRRRNHA